MKTKTWTLTILLVTAMLASSPNVLLPGAAQEEDPIGDTVNVTLPGFEAGFSGFIGNLAPMPSTPIDPFRVHSPFPDLNITVGDVEEKRVCVADDEVSDGLGLDDDTVPCELTVQHTLTATCDTLFEALHAIPHIGTPLADALEDTARTVDESIGQALSGAYDTLPESIRDNLGDSQWSDTTHDALVHCRGEIQSIRSLAGVDPSRLIVELGVDIDVCPWPEVIPHCEPVSDSAASTFETEEEQNDFSQNPCSFENLMFNCGNVQLKNETLGVDEEADPFEAWNRVVENLSAVLRIDLELSDYDQTTPGVFQAGLSSQGGGAGCELGGLPANSGVIPGSWTLSATASIVDGDFPLWPEVQETVNPLLVLIFDTVNGALGEASDTWHGTMNDIVGTINDAWNEEDQHEIAGESFSLGETLGLGGLHGDGGSLVTECGHTPPEVSTQVPEVDPEDLPPAP